MKIKEIVSEDVGQQPAQIKDYKPGQSITYSVGDKEIMQDLKNNPNAVTFDAQGKPIINMTAMPGQQQPSPEQQAAQQPKIAPGTQATINMNPDTQTTEEIGDIDQDREGDVGGDSTDDYIRDINVDEADPNKEFDPSWVGPDDDDLPGTVRYLEPGEKGLNAKDPGVQTLYPAQMTPELRRKYQIASFQKQNPGVPLPVELGGPGMPNNESVELSSIRKLAGL